MLRSRITMEPTQWGRTKAPFGEALAYPPDQRVAIVTAACGDDAALRGEVLSLLACDDEAGDFLEPTAASRLALQGGAESIARLAPGHRFGRYEIVSFLGAGAVSEVYRARDSRLGRTVALKLLTDPTAPDGAEWLLREARHASTLNHPHICTVHEVDEWEGRPFIVLECIEGMTLHAAMRQGPLPLDTIVGWALQIADALDHAHRHGVVHRDLKSSNVVVTPDQRVKILDFGLARRLEAGPDAAAAVLADASVAGTLTHIAPEVLAGSRADARVDVWALGVLLYQLVSGSVPFRGATPFATATAILEDNPAPLPATVAPALREIIERCLVKDPAARYTSVGEVRGALQTLAGEAAVPARSGNAPDHGTRAHRRWAAAVALLALVATGAYLGTTASEPTQTNRAASPRLAVLPVLDLDEAESDRFLADGVTEALIGALGRIDAIQVIAPASSGGFRGRPDAVAAAGRETRATAVLSGTLTRDGDRVRLATRLLEVSSGRLLWSAEHERPMRELHALYGAVARELAGAIDVELHQDDATRLSQVRSVDPGVYEAYLKGRYHFNQRTAESLHAAIAHYQTALRLDPTYAPVYAALADCYNQLGTQMVGGGSPREWRPKAREAAIRALQIDPGLAEAHATLGYVRHYDWDWAGAEQSFGRAIALNPSHALTRIWYANLLSALRRPDEALAQVTVATELDPLSPMIATNVAWVLINARRYAEAIAVLTPVVARDPGYVQARSRLAHAYALSGRPVDALEEADTANRLSGGSAATRVALAQVLAQAGRRAEAERLLAQLLADRDRHHVPTGGIANTYAALGRTDEALRWLTRSHEERTNNNAYLAVEPIYDSLRAHPRFQALIAATGLR
jgi:serine/threonine-protein kinase